MAKHVNTTENIQSPEDAALAAVGAEIIADAPKAEAPVPAEKKKKADKPKASAVVSTGAPQLTEEEIERLEAEAHEEVAKELKANLAKEYKDNFKASLKRKALFRDADNDEGDDLVPILIDLPTFCQNIKLDGVTYSQGVTYKVGRAKAAVIKEQIYRAHRHEDETSGADANKLAYRRHRRERLSGRA